MSREIKFRFWDKDLKKMCFRHPAKMDFSHPNITPMQFTGIKDKNGIEIYEGDIVKYKDDYTGIIQYWVGQICVGYRYKSGSATFALKVGNAMFMEIIGNIHENPELL